MINFILFRDALDDGSINGNYSKQESLEEVSPKHATQQCLEKARQTGICPCIGEIKA